MPRTCPPSPAPLARRLRRPASSWSTITSCSASACVGCSKTRASRYLLPPSTGPDRGSAATAQLSLRPSAAARARRALPRAAPPRPWRALASRACVCGCGAALRALACSRVSAPVRARLARGGSRARRSPRPAPPPAARRPLFARAPFARSRSVARCGARRPRVLARQSCRAARRRTRPAAPSRGGARPASWRRARAAPAAASCAARAPRSRSRSAARRLAWRRSRRVVPGASLALGAGAAGRGLRRGARCGCVGRRGRLRRLGARPWLAARRARPPPRCAWSGPPAALGRGAALAASPAAPARSAAA